MSNPLIDPEPTYLAPVELPADVAKLYAAREAAYDRFVDFEAEHMDVLDPMWQAHYAAIDRRNAAAAIRAGKDPFAGETELSKAEKRRARALGARDALGQDLRAADNALYQAWAAVVPDLIPGAGAALREAAEAYRKADNAARAARDVFRDAATVRTFLTLFKAGKQRAYGNGFVPRASVGSRGQEEINEVLTKLEAAGISDPYCERGDTDYAPGKSAQVISNGQSSYIRYS
ncbi:hypothetical protein [Streptomyces avermitilis]|uniref:hypothetical protein n=1 Tax=Streptomyces avermitilis TaxID=33903 RepID=UPI003803D284